MVWCRQWLDLFDCANEDHEREYAAMRRVKCLMAAEELTRLAQREANRKDSLQVDVPLRDMNTGQWQMN